MIGRVGIALGAPSGTRRRALGCKGGGVHKLVAFSTRWGAAFGGINSFNTDLLKALALGYDGRLKVCCVVPVASDQEREAARAAGIELKVVGCGDDQFNDAPELAVEAAKECVTSLADGAVAWLGHDRITGNLALEAAKALGGESILIHHMSYDHYEAFCESSLQAQRKVDTQRALFSRADKALAVGPLLRDALRDMLALEDAPPMLVPGLPDIKPAPAPKTFRAYLSGRVSADTNKIKQAHLGVAAFSHAIKLAENDRGLPDAMHPRFEPKLCLRGLDVEAVAGDVETDLREAERELRLFSEEYSDRAISLSALTFTPDRQVLFDELSRSSVAMMPSWHEGFGLVAWEAIAAGVPLIVSEKSGVYRLLQESDGGLFTRLVRVIDVRGSVTEPFFKLKDVEGLASELIDVAKDVNAARAQAIRLREAMATRHTWSICAETFIAALGWPIARGILPIAQPSKVVEPAEPKTPVATASPAAHWISLPTRLWAPGRGLSDSQLLRAEEARVPFDPDAEPFLQAQLAWAADPEFGVALRLITGAGGAGKTRLSLEMCRRLSEQGWESGFLKSDINVAAYKSLADGVERSQRPWLIVVDYAEARQDALIALTQALTKRQLNHKVRLLLLARDAGEWWDQLPGQSPVSQAILQGRATSGPFAMPKMHDSREKRSRAFDKAMSVFCELLGVQVPRVSPDLSPPHFIFPLYVQMAALAALLGESANSAEGLPRSLIHHEERYWRRISSADGAESNFADIERVVALATLVGGLKEWKSARDIWEKWVGTPASEFRAAFRLASSLYPDAERGGVLGLRPDLLGEALLTRVLLSNEGQGLLEATLKRGTPSMRRHTLATLTRILSRRPDLQSVVEDALAANFLSCARDVMDACLQAEGPLPDIVTRAFERLTMQEQLQCAGVLMPLFKVEIVPLFFFELALRKAVLEGITKKLKKHPNVNDRRIEYVEALRLLSISYSRCGQYLLGRDTAKAAMDVFLPLYAANKKRYQPGWASCLMNYSNRLIEAGDEGALDYVLRALAAWEEMERDHPGRYRDELAACLMNSANRLSEQGRHEEALRNVVRATTIFEELSRSDEDAYAVDLANAWHNQAALLLDAGQYAASVKFQQRTKEFYERAAKERPESFESDLAMGLFNYATALETLGDYPRSLSMIERSTQIYEALARARPTRFEAYWGDCLSGLASALLNLGPQGEALDLARKSVEVHRRNMANLPARYWMHWVLARCFETFAEWLLDPNRVPDLEKLEAEFEPWAGKERDRLRQQFCLDWFKYCINTSAEQQRELSAAARESWARMESNAHHLEHHRRMVLVLSEAKYTQDPASVAQCRDEWERFLDECSGRLPWWMQEVMRRKGLNDVFPMPSQPEPATVED